MSLSAVRTGLKNALSTVEGLRCFDFMVDSPALPAAVVKFPDTIDPRAVLGDGFNYMIGVTLFVSRADDRGGDAALEAFLAETGDGSVIAALRADNTLDGACDSAEVTEVTNFGYGEIGGVSVFRCDLMVEIYT